MTKLGLTGSIIAAVCCFTPLVPFILAAVGLTAWGVYADAVLLPLLAAFLLLTAWGFLRGFRRRASRSGASAHETKLEH